MSRKPEVTTLGTSNLFNEGRQLTLAVYTDVQDTAVFQIRILSPATQLGWKILRGNTKKGVNFQIIEQADLVIIQRDNCRDIENYEHIVTLAHSCGIPVIIEIDDLLFDLPVDHPGRIYGHYLDALLPLLLAINEADLVTVSTPNLGDFLSPINSNIRVIPNYLDDNLWKIKPAKVIHDTTKPLTICYMGSKTHSSDLLEVLPALLHVAAKYSSKIRFSFLGSEPPNELEQISKVDKYLNPIYDYVEFVKFFQKQSSDIVIAPLQNNLFNSCKSPIKFFEYTANGFPGVYSRLAPYEGVITNGKEGMLSSSIDEWVKALSTLIESTELRNSLIENAQVSLRNKWLLSRNIEVFRDVYIEAINLYGKKYNTQPNLTHLIRTISEQYSMRTEQQESAYKHLQDELLDCVTSPSWKITRPLRKIGRLLRREEID